MSVFGDELCPHRELIFAECDLTSLMSEFFWCFMKQRNTHSNYYHSLHSLQSFWDSCWNGSWFSKSFSLTLISCIFDILWCRYLDDFRILFSCKILEKVSLLAVHSSNSLEQLAKSLFHWRNLKICPKNILSLLLLTTKQFLILCTK